MPARKSLILPWISLRFSHGRALQRGFLRFARHREDWELMRGLDPASDRIDPHLRRADAIVAFIDRPALRDRLRSAKIPVVNVAWSVNNPPGVSVVNDDHAIGVMAAEHFLDRGHRSFAFVGVKDRPFSDDRRAGFVRRLVQAGFDTLCHQRPLALRASSPEWFKPEPPLRRFIRALPPQCAIFAAADAISVTVATACQQLGRRIPEDVAILGVNNDELLCESITPPLSSVQPAVEQIGYRAAAELADLLAGKPAPAAPIRLAPMGVVTRPSTDTLAVDDPVVASALAFIRARVEHPTTVEDVLDHLTVSRKGLERKFARILRRTPLEEIRRAHVARVQSLLVHTDAPMARVALRAGFTRAEHMATVFRKLTGMTPTAYREQFRNR